MNLEHIGTFVAKIVADPRTLNRAVIAWEHEVTQLAALELGGRISGEGEAMKAMRVSVAVEAVLQLQAEGEASVQRDPTTYASRAKRSMAQNANSLNVLKENTLENAKRLGYLDARELYPDVPVQSFEDFAKEWYSLPEPGFVYERY